MANETHKRKGPGRPPKAAGHVKGSLTVRITDAERETIERVARERSLNLSELISLLIGSLNTGTAATPGEAKTANYGEINARVAGSTAIGVARENTIHQYFYPTKAKEE